MAEPTTTGHTEHAEHRDIRGRGGFIISGLTGGHGVFHWFTQSFLIMLPEVRDTFKLTEVAVGSITGTREWASGAITLPGGVVMDMLRRYWGLVLALCMGGFGIGWLIIGAAPVFPLLLVGMAVTAVAASIWHLPAMASLSHHFSHRRGTALSFHGVGGNIGDALAPAVTGVLLGVFTWQGILSVYAAVPIFLAFLVFWAFRNIGRGMSSEASSDHHDGGHSQMAETTRLLKTPLLWGITVVSGLRGMSFVAFLTFLPLYLNDEVGFKLWERGLLVGLLMAVGIVSTPVMGYLSDRFGRKLVLVPGLLVLCVIALLLVPFGEGVTLWILVAAMGLFLFSDQPILTAAALDIVGSGVASTTLGILSFARALLSGASPLIAGWLYGHQGPGSHFIYVAAILGLAAIILLFLPLRGTGDHVASDHHH